MLKLWRADYDKQIPVLVECPNGRYPNRDAEGHMVYNNSHFDTEEDAWERLRANALAFVESAGRHVDEMELMLAKANEKAGAAAKMYALMVDNYNKRGVTTLGFSTDDGTMVTWDGKHVVGEWVDAAAKE